MSKKDLKSKLMDALLENADATKRKPTISKKSILMAISILAISIFSVVTFVSQTPAPQKTPLNNTLGQITKPIAEEITGEQVLVNGKTQNIEPGQYIWLAVDKPELDLCWPKTHIQHPNISFCATILEQGKEEPYTLSLYIVDKTTHDHWQQWVGQGRLGGLHVPPDRKRLDSVELFLKRPQQVAGNS